MTYASVTSNNQTLPDNVTTINNVAEIKEAFWSAQKENDEEEQSRASRRSNIIVRGVAEETTELTDDLRVKKLLEDTHTKASVKNIARLGKAVEKGVAQSKLFWEMKKKSIP